MLVPVGSAIDSRRGAVELTAATGDGATNPARVFGYFRLRQEPVANAVTELRMLGGGFARCKEGARVTRRISATASGPWRTTGRYASATVQGTQWLQKDSCDGTLTKVIAGTVTARDFVLSRTVTLGPGQSYLARRR
jgi:hypothetical protein